jgi:hypothetical protein
VRLEDGHPSVEIRCVWFLASHDACMDDPEWDDTTNLLVSYGPFQ